MERGNKLRLGLLLSCTAIFLTGCFGKKKKSDKDSVDYAMTNKRKKGMKRWDPTLEAYVFEGEAEDMKLAQSKEFQKIYYDFDRTDVRDDQRPVVDYDAHLAKAKAQDGASVMLIGKSDTHCISEVYNTAVSQKRADQIAQEFTLAGVSADKVSALGVGDTQLEVPHKGKEPLNRCVVVQVG